MPATHTPRTSFRLTEAELERLDDLARRWGGPVRALSRTDAVREAIRRCHEGMEGKPSPRPAKGGGK